ncbi:gtrA-like protein domain-containing protein [Ditylenchus destructor]|uniref:GtrA-like protein domain-containing protein n=1 Tax=Ditylenchus destructor TaxID=166010 RepID=A0AAD4QW21_9BILA|nr:gtrA-like protein domain-containing protein [Ditylenchus destructor]
MIVAIGQTAGATSRRTVAPSAAIVTASGSSGAMPHASRSAIGVPTNGLTTGSARPAADRPAATNRTSLARRAARGPASAAYCRRCRQGPARLSAPSDPQEPCGDQRPGQQRPAQPVDRQFPFQIEATHCGKAGVTAIIHRIGELQRSGVLGQLVRFGIVGVASTVIYSAVYLPLVWWVFPNLAVAAVPFAFAVAVTCGFFMHSAWSFKDTARVRIAGASTSNSWSSKASGCCLTRSSPG